MREREVNWDYCVIKIDLLGIVVDAVLWVEGTKHILLERRKSAVEDGKKQKVVLLRILKQCSPCESKNMLSI